jgi:hypothetical protein
MPPEAFEGAPGVAYSPRHLFARASGGLRGAGGGGQLRAKHAGVSKPRAAPAPAIPLSPPTGRSTRAGLLKIARPRHRMERIGRYSCSRHDIRLYSHMRICQTPLFRPTLPFGTDSQRIQRRRFVTLGSSDTKRELGCLTAFCLAERGSPFSFPGRPGRSAFRFPLGSEASGHRKGAGM